MSHCPRCGHAFAAAIPSSPSSPAGAGGTGRGPVTWGSVEVALGVLTMALAVVLVAGAALALMGASDPALAAWTTSLLLGLVILPVAWALGPRRLKGALPALGLKAPRQSWPRAAAMTAGVLIASLAATALYSRLVEWWGWPVLAPPEIPKGIVFPGAAAVLTFLALAVWTPITEELFFRGFVLGGLAARWGGAGAGVLSALIFSLFHIVPGLLLPVLLTGLLLAWLYRRTGSLWPCVAAHAGQNALALAAAMSGLDKAA